MSITQIRDAGSGLTAGGDTASRGVVGEVGKGAESEMDVDDDEILQRKGGEGMDDRTRHLDGRNVLVKHYDGRMRVSLSILDGFDINNGLIFE